MSTFISVNSLQNGELPPTDVSYVNFSQIAYILCEGVNLILVSQSGFNLYMTFDNSTDCQAYAASLVTSIG